MSLMDNEEANRFAQAWLQAWNGHDLDRVLDHFTEDVVFTSPVAVHLVPGSDGVVQGKAALREYWGEGLRRLPDLHFEVLGVYLGVDVVVINYRNERGHSVNEVLVFEGSRVRWGHGTYLGGGGDPAGARP
jgi:ketosteroid isomerase-like protein